MRVLQLVTSLRIGGAEVMLRNVVRGLDPRRYQSYVVSLTGKEPIGRELEAHNIPVIALNGQNGMISPSQFLRARRIIKEWRPDVIHAWMYHANVIAQMLSYSMVAKRRPPVITSVRGALSAPGVQKRMLRIVRRVDALWSGRSQSIIFNSTVSARQHAEFGYDSSKFVVVPNGFDTTLYAPSMDDRARIRAELNIGRVVLIGLVARFDPLKGHRLFLEAAASVAAVHSDWVFALIGRNCDSENDQLRSWIDELGLADRTRLLGERRDIPAILNALDIAISSSLSESFPNAIGEAMACGKPCIVTDVGDCAYLVGDAGLVVSAGDATALSTSIMRLAALPNGERELMGRRGRQRIEREFSIEAVVRRYAGTYDRVTEAHVDNSAT